MADAAPLATSWHPEYPDPVDEEVELLDFELETYISDRRPGITAQNYSVEGPAVFWTDSSHIYVRLNWKQWVTVSVSTPEHVAAICAARYCRITSSMNNVIKDDTAPVYRVETLPREIFFSVEEKAANEARSCVAGPKEFFESQRQVIEILQTVGGDTSVFPNVEIGGDHAAVAISNETFAVLLDILPEGHDFTFCPRTGTNQHNPMNRWETDVVSLDFVDTLKRLGDTLKSSEGEDAGVKIGLVANWNTLDNFREIADEETLAELSLFTYDSLAEGIKELFALQNDDEGSC